MQFTLTQCDFNSDLVRTVKQYARDVEKASKGWGVSVLMSEDKEAGTLSIACEGENHVAVNVLGLSIMTAAMIVGANEDEEWIPIMQDLFEVISKNQEEAEQKSQQLYKNQLKLAEFLRMNAKEEKARSHMQAPTGTRKRRPVHPRQADPGKPNLLN